MSWGFRKSISFGGVRFSFSKRGVSTSIGGHGVRLTSGPRGVYVTAGARGFYYRQRLDSQRRPPSTSRDPGITVRPAPDSADTTYFTSADVGFLTDVSQDEFVRSLNEWTRRGGLQLIGVVLGLLLVGIAAITTNGSGILEAALYVGIALAFIRHVELRRRRFVMFYDLDSAAAKQFAALESGLERAASAWLRSVKAHQLLGDWKRNAGATGALKTGPVTLGRRQAPLIVSNVEPYALDLEGMTLFFFPDRVLVRASNGMFAGLSYQAVQTSVTTASFIWSDANVPPGSNVVGYTWQYVRKDGGPDRRFSGNRQLPVILMGYLGLESQTGLKVLLQSTSESALEAMARSFSGRIGNLAGAHGAPATSVPGDVRDALICLGLSEVPSADVLKTVYRELAQRNHPDKHARSGADVRAFAEERMKEINRAYAVLQGLARPHEGGTQVAEGSTDIHQDQRTPLWRHPTVGRAAAALLCCGVVFGLFRNAPGSTPSVQLVTPSFSSFAAPESSEETVLLRGCYIRTSPSSSATSLGSLAPRAKVAVMEHKDQWLKVRTTSGQTGWLGPGCFQQAKHAGERCSSDWDCDTGACSRAEDGPGTCVVAPSLRPGEIP